jgi:oligoendopeptidase F
MDKNTKIILNNIALEDLPIELLEYINEFLDPYDEASLKKVNKYLNNLRKSNKFLLYEAIFLNNVNTIKKFKNIIQDIDIENLLNFLRNNKKIQSKTIKIVSDLIQNKSSNLRKKLFEIYNDRWNEEIDIIEKEMNQ